ncbi:unnamed protein product [Bursaphelenchus okinawaensis]|uniref:Uncharacterized protein n=1 Tax=Bursaphelenchus okinawaensis TaxID=465554 RepID=A0A811KDC4_9BILA|nr:unnamed protein product [Bursaphelenchus okinawaensis]CAG9101482.1 unnamed protein product [Bursaphelenchus okinawaensis]
MISLQYFGSNVTFLIVIFNSIWANVVINNVSASVTGIQVVKDCNKECKDDWICVRMINSLPVKCETETNKVIKRSVLANGIEDQEQKETEQPTKTPPELENSNNIKPKSRSRRHNLEARKFVDQLAYLVISLSIGFIAFFFLFVMLYRFAEAKLEAEVEVEGTVESKVEAEVEVAIVVEIEVEIKIEVGVKIEFDVEFEVAVIVEVGAEAKAEAGVGTGALS